MCNFLGLEFFLHLNNKNFRDLNQFIRIFFLLLRIRIYDNSVRIVPYSNGQYQSSWIGKRKRDITLYSFQNHSCDLDVLYGPFSTSNIWLGSVSSRNIRSWVSFLTQIQFYYLFLYIYIYCKNYTV